MNTKIKKQDRRNKQYKTNDKDYLLLFSIFIVLLNVSRWIVDTTLP